MNDQSSHLNNSGAPPTGLRHLAPWVKVIAGGGAVAAIAFYALQVSLPDRFRPSSVAGEAAGDTVRHEIEASREAKIDMERRIADATAQANAKAQADLIAITAAINERTANLAGLQGTAVLSDIACAAAHVVSGLTQPQGFNRSSTDDYYRTAQKVGAATCGVSDGLRREITDSQLEAIRTAAAERGAPINDGAVRTVSSEADTTAQAGADFAQASQFLPKRMTLAEVYNINESPLHFTNDVVIQTVQWIKRQPNDVQQHLWTFLPDGLKKADDVLVMRAAAYNRYING